MDTPSSDNIPPIPEQSPAPLVSISITWFLSRFTSGVHNFVTTSRAFGDYIKTIDKDEIYSHVDYPKHTPNLAFIYPIDSWRHAVARQAYLKEASELSREERFALEERAKELQKKFAARDQMIYTYTNITRKRAPALYTRLNNSEKKLRELVIYFLNGQGKKEVLERLDIDEDAIEIFKSYPTPSHEENSILEMMEAIRKNQEETHKESMKDAIVANPETTTEDSTNPE